MHAPRTRTRMASVAASTRVFPLAGAFEPVQSGTDKRIIDNNDLRSGESFSAISGTATRKRHCQNYGSDFTDTL